MLVPDFPFGGPMPQLPLLLQSFLCSLSPASAGGSSGRCTRPTGPGIPHGHREAYHRFEERTSLDSLHLLKKTVNHQVA